MGTARNQPCPCGSGEKHKRCCMAKRAERQWIWVAGTIAGLLFLIGGAVVALRERAVPPQGKVWSEEHGHWHDADDLGTPPPGQVWSEEHGHWHDAPQSP